MTKSHYILLLLLVSMTVCAKERSTADMKSIAAEVLQRQSTRSTASEIACLKETETYCIYGDKMGFAVISRDDKSDAVLGYSMTPFDEENIPCGLSWWLNAVEATLLQTSIISHKTITRGESTVIEPMIISKWGQGDPYNAKCPTFKGKKAPVGCVATAMAQLMFFYNYPEKAQGVGYYTLGDASHQYSITVNSIYDWSQIKASYAGSWFMTEDEKQNIAQLAYDAGVASHMNYASDGSGSTAYDAANGFGQIFQFDSLAMKCISRDYCVNDDEWRNIIINEFKSGHPLIMCGQDMTQGGHCFIIDGLDKDGLVHVNWGWDGKSDGYYNLTDMNPSGILGSSSTMHFNFSQSVITNVKCQPNTEEGEIYRSCLHFDSEDNLISDNMNGLIISGPETIRQHYHLTFYGQFGIRFADNEGKEVFFCPLFDTAKKGIGPVEGGHGYYMSYFNHATSADLADLPEGTYKVTLVSKALQDIEPQPIRYPGGKHNEYVVTKSPDGFLTIEKTGSVNIRLSEYATPETNYIYDLQGRSYGTSAEGLPKGLYIIGGKKVVK